jgi:hypothetical protein
MFSVAWKRLPTRSSRVAILRQSLFAMERADARAACPTKCWRELGRPYAPRDFTPAVSLAAMRGGAWQPYFLATPSPLTSYPPTDTALLARAMLGDVATRPGGRRLFRASSGLWVNDDIGGDYVIYAAAAGALAPLLRLDLVVACRMLQEIAESRDIYLRT